MTKCSNFSHHFHPDIFALIVQPTFSISWTSRQIFNSCRNYLSFDFQSRFRGNVIYQFSSNNLSSRSKVKAYSTSSQDGANSIIWNPSYNFIPNPEGRSSSSCFGTQHYHLSPIGKTNSIHDTQILRSPTL